MEMDWKAKEGAMSSKIPSLVSSQGSDESFPVVGDSCGYNK